MFCVFIHGPVASGKLTIAKALQQRTGWALHHNHLAVDAALALHPFGSTAFIDLRAALWRAVFDSAARHERSFIFTFAPERTVPRQLVDELVSIVEAVAGRVHFVELACDEGEIERRIVSTERAQHLKLNDAEMYRNLRAAGAFASEPMPPPILRIASDAHSPTDAATLIEAAVLQA